MQAALPLELIELILAYVDDSGPSLNSLASSARSFRAICQRRIFRTLVVQDAASGFRNTFARLASLLEVSPRISFCVRSLKTPLPKVTSETRAFYNIVRALREAGSVIRCVITTRRGCDWSSLPRVVRDEMGLFFAMGSLEKLHLAKMTNFPVAALEEIANNVEILSLSEVFLHIESVGEERRQSRLEYLILPLGSTVYHHEQFFRTWFLRDEFPSLRRLSLGVNSSLDDTHLAVLEPLGAQLDQLELNLRTIRSNIPFPAMPLLRTLEVTFNLGISRVFPENISGIISRLRGLSPRLERLVLVFQIMPTIPEVAWDHVLDAALVHSATPAPLAWVGLEALEHLQDVSCCLHLMADYFHGDNSALYDGFVESIENKVPSALKRSGRLGFSRRASSYRYEDHLP